MTAAASDVVVATERYTITGRRKLAVRDAAPDTPLVVALPGGTYTSAYFDVPGYSLLDRAAALGISVLALDRPGYAGSTPLPPAESTIERNAERLDEAIGKLWNDAGSSARGIVLVGQSIGGAIAIEIASRRPSWPLLGIAVSGVGLLTASADGARYSGLPPIPMIDLPPAIKDRMMFGPPWTYAADMPEGSHVADAPVPRAELIDITHTWSDRVRGLAAKVTVPVHYRQARFDPLWITGDDQVAGFAAAFSAAPFVDARAFEAAGHCIDFHRLGLAFQLEQLAFALRCAVAPE